MYNAVILSGVSAWLVAQIIKTILHAIKSNKVVYERFVGAGGMPSSHTSMVISSLITVGRSEGIGSTLFGVMFIFSAIVIYDAMGVRHAAGEQAKEINSINKILLKGMKSDSDKKELKELLGHTPLEVAAGAILGVIIGMIIPIKG